VGKIKNNIILDPTWITKGKYLDHEYQWYILMAAKSKYLTNFKNGNLDNFYELLFHYLNLNNLVLNGEIYDNKLNIIKHKPRLREIYEHLTDNKNIDTDGILIVRDANILFSNLLLTYLEEKLKILGAIKLAYNNRYIHTKDQIFFMVNINCCNVCDIWRLKIDSRHNFGYYLEKIKTITVDTVEPDIIKTTVERDTDPRLLDFSVNDNVIVGIAQRAIDPREVAFMMKDITLINMLFNHSNGFFDQNVFIEMYALLNHKEIIPLPLSTFLD